MYLNTDKLVFTTLCVGDKYRDVIQTQLQSVIKFSPYDHYVITDKPEVFGDYYGPRIHYISLDEAMKNYPLPLQGKTGIFNYNLKMIPLKWVFENIKPTVCCYMDADTWLFGEVPKMLMNYFPDGQEGIWARFRHALNDSGSHKIILEKLKTMGVDAFNISTRLPIEHIMFWKNGPTINKVLGSWYNYAMSAYNLGARTDFECIELCLSIHEHNLHHIHICQDLLSDMFRCLHGYADGVKIHTPFVI